ncbi:MAG TPA: serine/threonine-protein kinase [Gemmatimonadales bacterium]|nr:serine/threonine-protein kinase [Gemmatimonadales bacterium]
MKPELVARFQAALAGRYTIDRELGRGGMATVFLAHDRDGTEVALKLLNPDLGSSIGGDRFRREIRVATQLQHPNILGVLDSGVTEIAPGVHFLWFTMPLVRGVNVWERFEQTGTFTPDEVVRIGRAVADALAFAHEKGVVHRDIKPDNILLEGERVLVADFGVARAVSEVHEKLTATGMVVGTPTYMSPEQASGEREIDGRSDVFALACVLYELLAGEAPFDGPTPQAALMRRFTGPPRALRPVIDVPEALEAALLKSLARDPKDRHQTAAAFSEALAGRPPAPPAPEPAASAPKAGGRGCLGSVVLFLAFGWLGVAAGCGQRDATIHAGAWQFKVDTIPSQDGRSARQRSFLRVVGREGPEGQPRAKPVILSFDCVPDQASSTIMTDQALRQGSVEAKVTVDGGAPRRLPGFAGTTPSGGQVVLTARQDSLLAALSGHERVVVDYADGAGSSHTTAEFPLAGLEKLRESFLAACAKRGG